MLILKIEWRLDYKNEILVIAVLNTLIKYKLIGYKNGVINMNRKILAVLLSASILATASASILAESSASTHQKVTERFKESKIEKDSSPNNVGRELLELKDTIPKSINLRDNQQIKDINKQLRWKYLNQSKYYASQDNLAKIDSGFNTVTRDEMYLHANLVPADFGVAPKYFTQNAEKVYNSMIKDTQFGIDHGYFFGNKDEQPLEPASNEYIRINIKLPKGTPVMKVGNEKDSNYILPRETVLKYTNKSFDKKSKIITITAEIAEKEDLNKLANDKQKELNDEVREHYGAPSNFIKISPLGLNAGYVINESSNTVLKTFQSLEREGVYSKDLLKNEKLELTNGWFGHLDLFEQEYEEKSLEERREIFDEEFDPGSSGETINYMAPQYHSIITFAHLSNTDTLPQMSTSEDIAATILHEEFHYLTYSTKGFKNIPLYKDGKNSFIKDANLVKKEEEETLVKLLNDNYAKDDWEEYTSEAFMAKVHPIKEISDEFKKTIPKTNRLLDKLFDTSPPSTPTNLKALDVGGDSVKLTFDHSSDNIGVDKYDIYMDGKRVKTVSTEKDDNGLSYSKPGDFQDNLEITIDDLEQITDYEFQVVAVDDTQNESNKSSILKVKTKDTEPPQLHGKLEGSPLVSNAVRFNWSHPTDNDKVKEVKLYRKESSDKSLMSDKSSLTKQEQVFTVPSEENYYTDFTVEKGKSYTYYLVAFDESGNKSENSNLITVQTNDKDDEKKNEDKAENVTYSQATLNWTGAFPGISPSGFHIFSWIFSGGQWAFNGVSSVLGTATSTLVNLKPGLSHQFVVIPVDDNGNPLISGLQISVDSIDKSSLKTKDSTLYTTQGWHPRFNFVSATDEDGNSISYDDDRIVTTPTTIDVSKPGKYEIKYTYKGISKNIDSLANVTVKEDKSSIIAKDSTVKYGEKWSPTDNFVSATDKDGNPLGLNSELIKVIPNGDMSKPGGHYVDYYVYGDVEYQHSRVNVNVEGDKSSITTKDTKICVGQEWNPVDNFVKATDEYGKTVDFKDSRIDIGDAKIDTSKPGEYTIKYSFKGLEKTSTSTFKVEVVDNLIVNGDFSKGFEGWSVDGNGINLLENDHGKYVDMKLKGYSKVEQNSIIIDPNSVYEVSYLGRGVSHPNIGNAHLMLYKTRADGGRISTESVNVTDDGEWRKYSTIINDSDIKYNKISLTFKGTMYQNLQFTDVAIKRIR